MANPIVKVELGSNVSVPGDVFTLDDGAKGLLAAVSTLRTNLITNPSFETNITGWYTGQTSIVQSNNFSYSGANSGLVTVTSGADTNLAYWTQTGIISGQTYTYSFYSYVPAGSSLAGRTLNVNIEGAGATYTLVASSAATLISGTWVRSWITITATSSGSFGFVHRYSGAIAVGSTIYFDAAMLEQTSVLGDYFDGNFPPVGDTIYTFTGTANASTSIATGIVTTGVYPLAGIPFIDATSYVKTFSIGRGKSRELDRYQAGHITVKFDNTKRYFDPTFTGSPFYGQIVPRRPIRVTVKGIVQFTGIVDDWDLSFTVDGQSEAVCNANDSMAVLAQQNLSTDTYPQENTGARINRVLNSAGVVYDSIARTIDPGQMFVAAQTVDATIGALDHLQQVETSESGSLFIDKNGNVVFQDSSRVIPATTLANFGDNNIDIGYQGMQIIYGSELLYNSANVSRTGGVTQTFVDNTSATTYGLRNIDQSTLLSDDIQTARLAAWIVQQYAQPEFRFESIDVSLGDSTVTEQSTLLKLEIGDKCQIIYTPANVPPALTKFAQIIGIDHNADPNQHIVTFHFKTLDYNLLLLDDTVYGLLDSYYLGL